MANRKFLVPESGPDGSPGAPTYTFLNGLTTGLYYAGSNGLGLSTNGGTRLTITSGGNVTLAAPTSGVGLTISGGGATITGTTISTLLQTSQAAGANAAAPDHSFSGDTNTGMYSSAADTLNFSVGGTSRLQVNGTEVSASGVPLTTVTQAGAPASTPSDGALAVDTTNNRFYFRSGGTWRTVLAGGFADYLVTSSGTGLWFPPAGEGLTFPAAGGGLVFGSQRQINGAQTDLGTVGAVLATLISDLITAGVLT